MAVTTPLFEFLEYSAAAVEAALARGETPEFAAATPTLYDAFFSLADRLGVLAGIEALTDPRKRPFVPLPLLIMLTICRFLHAQPSFRRVGELLLTNQALLERLGVAPLICEQGYYRNCERQPFNEELFSEVLRRVDPEQLQQLLVQAVQALRQENPQWFAEGRFLMDSNHFTLKGSRQEYKWCVLLLWTPRGLIPVAIEFSAVPGDGETTIGKRVVARAIATYGERFLRLLIMDSGYLDGKWLRELRERHRIDWLIKAKEGMVVVREMTAIAADQPRWQRAAPPKLDLPKAELPVRHLCHTPRLFGVESYGLPVNGCLVRDRYPRSAKHPEGLETTEYLITCRQDWSGAVINTEWRRRWDVESTFGQLTRFWKLGQWPIELFAVYRALILIMALVLSLLVAYLTPERHQLSLQGVADRLTQQQREPRLLVRVGGVCALATPTVLNRWLREGLIRLRPPPSAGSVGRPAVSAGAEQRGRRPEQRSGSQGSDAPERAW